MDLASRLRLYRCLVTSRKVDEYEQELVQRGEAFFHVSGSGHEGSAGVVPHLIADDYLHVHYRSKAMMLARGYTVEKLFQGLHSKDGAECHSRQMVAHVSDVTTNICSMSGPVGNAALHAAGMAAALKDRPQQPIVVLALGDGTTQEGEVLEALAEAARENLPVLFLIEDNGWAISTTTAGKTFYGLAGRESPREFHGIPITTIDGRDVLNVHAATESIVAQMRRDRGPQIVVLNVERLHNHTNADDQTIYRTEADIARSRETGDPLRILERHLLADGVTKGELEKIKAEVAAEVRAIEARVYAGADPEPIFTAKQPVAAEVVDRSREHVPPSDETVLAMKDAIREVLRHHLASDERVSLLGQDIEDPKGDVFGATKGLSTQFPGRVRNAALTESTIIGTSIGRALVGERPVAFLQFADFLPLAFNQIVMDLATMWWRTDGSWTSPVIVMVPCGGYRPGLGPFHSHSFESILAHTPGLDVMLPSTAADAAGMLNAAFASGRPTLFFYPKACLNDPEQTTSGSVAKHFVPIGRARKVRAGRDITLVGWGNTVKLCRKTAEALEAADVEAEVIDLRSLSPWDEQMVLASAEKTGRLVVVHEDTHTCGLGGEILATVAEKSRTAVAMRRIARPDTFVPCNFSNQIAVLPSLQRVVETCAELLDLDVAWIAPTQTTEGNLFSLEAVGSGPSDEAVQIVELFVKPGDTIVCGQAVAELEATKGTFELTSPVAGTLLEILAAEGDSLPVGDVLMKIQTADAEARRKPVTKEMCGTPVLRRKPQVEAPILLRREAHNKPRRYDVGMAAVSTVRGKRVVTNAELLPPDSDKTADDIFNRTGIETRCWVGEGETALTMATQAATAVLAKEHLLIDELDLVICTTTSPQVITPSLACLVVDQLAGKNSDAMTQAYDINAACSGYLYALQAAYDFLQSNPRGRVMLVTSEVLSPLVDRDDFGTSIIFGDAASATLIYGEEHLSRTIARLRRPDVSARGEDGSILKVPVAGDGFIHMQGRRVFSEAVRLMLSSLNRTCAANGLTASDLKVIVPHQANQRIADAIANRVTTPVYSNIRHLGNTSSTSIPLCLEELLPKMATGDRVGLCAFGGGFTFGAAILEITAQQRQLNAAA
jgi:2-oxoisovalerate dehydrogenase E1 component